MSLPLALSSWVRDMRDRAISHTRENDKWESITKWIDPQDIEFDGRVRNAIAQENTNSETWNDQHIVVRAMKAHGMGLVDYLESVLGGNLGGRSEDPDSSVSAGSSHPDSDSPAA